MVEIVVTQAMDGQRLDRLIKAQCKDMPFVAVQKLIRTGKIRVDGKKVKADARLTTGQVVAWPDEVRNAGEGSGPVYQVTKADREMVKACTLFEDEALLVLNKPAGLAVQAGSGQVRSLDRILVGMYGQDAPKLTHRLDRETTGVLVLAKTRAAAADVTKQFAARGVEKVYLALLAGELPGKSGDIRAPLGKVAGQFGSRSVVSDEGDSAHTSWRFVARTVDGFNLVEATPHTGRMNQLRAHFAHIACPIIGDSKYGGRVAGSGPLFLHAWRVGFRHPISGARLVIKAAPAEHFHVLTFNADNDIIAQYS